MINCLIGRSRTLTSRLYLMTATLLLVSSHSIFSQQKYGLKATNLQEYLQDVKSNPDNELIDLETIPGIVLDVRYATDNNFTGERIYTLAKAYARKPVAEALRKIQADLKEKGLGVKIFDAYRPYRATVRFYEVYRDTTYVASPYRGSRHNRGCALDLTLIELSSGRELKMPTGYDSFTKAAWPSTPVSDPLIKKNRETLIAAMQKHGFRVNSSEWWHFDFIGWKKYDVLDIEFEELE